MGDEEGYFPKNSAPDDDIWGTRDKTVSEDLRMMLPSFFTKETGTLRLNFIILSFGRHMSRTKQWRVYSR
jgi:hypothetical protein